MGVTDDPTELIGEERRRPERRGHRRGDERPRLAAIDGLPHRPVIATDTPQPWHDDATLHDVQFIGSRGDDFWRTYCDDDTTPAASSTESTYTSPTSGSGVSTRPISVTALAPCGCVPNRKYGDFGPTVT